MKLILQKIKPKLLELVIFVTILLVQLVCFSSNSITSSYFKGNDSPVKIQLFLGIGGSIILEHTHNSSTYEINWITLFTNLAISYILAILLARFFIKTTSFCHPVKSLCSIFLGVIIITFIISITISKMYWGYFISRPSVLKETHDVQAISAIIPITTKTTNDKSKIIVIKKDYSMIEKIKSCNKDQYYCLTGRLLVKFNNLGLIPKTNNDNLNFPFLFQTIKQTGILTEPEKGYNNSDLLQGFIIDAISKTKKRLIFIALTGKEVSNDHYPYYEMVFTKKQNSPNLSYINGQRFFYDLAGIEGFEWYVIWLNLSFIGIIVSIPIVTLSMLSWKSIKNRRLSSY